MSSNGSIAVAGAEDGFAYLYDLKGGGLITTIRTSQGDGAINGVKFGRGLKTFTCCSEDGSIVVFDVNGSPLRMFEAVPYGEFDFGD